MKNKITSIIAAITLTASGIAFAAPLSTHAADDNICKNDNIIDKVKEAAGCYTTANVESAVGNIIQTIIGILGLVAIIFIVIGGIQYMTSTGDPGKIKKAKDTILYACIGLVIAALAFTITNFAIKAINGPTSPASSCPPGQTLNEATGFCE